LFKKLDTGNSDFLLDTYEEKSKGHGRNEKRIIDAVSADLSTTKDQWQNLQTIARVQYRSTKDGNESVATRYFLSSLGANARYIGYIIRNHWSIENNLHWVLDVVFDEDAAKSKKDNSPVNMNVLRKTALSLLMPLKQGRTSLKKMMFRAALESEFLELVLFG
jgi:predicted transposase YbfD/YdcC